MTLQHSASVAVHEAALGISGNLGALFRHRRRSLARPAWLDGAASIVIGVILAVTALLLAIETKGLLIGEAAAPELVGDIRAIVEATPAVDMFNEVRTLHRWPAAEIRIANSLQTMFRFRLAANGSPRKAGELR